MRDGFYTQLADIEREIGHYKNHFKGKIVFCNGDAPRVSNFFTTFHIKDEIYDAKKLEEEIVKLMQDEDVTKKSWIYSYVMTRNEKYLSIRAFTDKQKREAYERQEGICTHCKEHFEFEEKEEKPSQKIVRCFVKCVIEKRVGNKKDFILPKNEI